MDNIGDFIYVLLMIGAVIFSIWRKSKQEATPPVSNPKREFKDLFPEIPNWMGDDEDEYAGKAPNIPFERPRNEDQTLETPAPPVFTYDAPSVAVPGRIIVKSNPVVVDGGLENEPHMFDEEPFDVRKAVLYSEILKRPTW
jgi:hypothetical protein